MQRSNSEHRSVSKSDLADLYNVSSQTLYRWLSRSDIREKLDEAGYNPSQRILTPKQYDIIKEFLGKP